MDIGLILLTLACFVGGIWLSRWQARRHFRNSVADRMTNEVEKELARRVLEGLSQQDKDALKEKLLEQADIQAGDSKPI